ncbi:CCA tRNA nucleotidyltransferase [Candidatus Woesearchaeota archaeon]|nr:CCA tRNA nucleotidyltransferase [Candidatus Woesearchaeota archaeon]
MNPIAYEILQKIKPSKEEQNKVEKTTELFLTKLNAKLKDAKAILGGSGAKGTWLAGAHDVDIFVRFEKEDAGRGDTISELLQAFLKKAFPTTPLNRLHGSRDYFQLKFEGLNFEIVPIMKISKATQAKNITDISPLHSLWVNKNTKKSKEDILLAKQFCKANGMYGAESYITGFSGYVLEILIAHYGSFEKLLKASLNWKVKEVIDVEKHYPKKDVLFQLNQSKLQSPLIVIDPVDKNRNAAAALSLEKFLRFKQKAKEYLAGPNVNFFVKEKISEQKLNEEAQKKKLNLVLLRITPLEGKEDVVGVKLVKALELVKERLKPFEIKKSGWEWDGRALFYVLLGKRELPHEEIKIGPPLSMKEFVQEFRRKYKNTFEKNHRIMAKVKRATYQLEPLVKEMLKEKYIRVRVTDVKASFF